MIDALLLAGLERLDAELAAEHARLRAAPELDRDRMYAVMMRRGRVAVARVNLLAAMAEGGGDAG
jgi:hypothetical protein